MKQINKETEVFLKNLVEAFEQRERALQKLISQQSQQLESLSHEVQLIGRNYSLTMQNYKEIVERLEESEKREARLSAALQSLNATLSA